MKNTVLLQEFLTVVFSSLENIGATSNKWKKSKQLGKYWQTLANKSLGLSLLYYYFSNTKTNIKHYWFQPAQQKRPYGFPPHCPLHWGAKSQLCLADCSETASIQQLCAVLKLSLLHLFPACCRKFAGLKSQSQNSYVRHSKHKAFRTLVSSQHLKIREQYCQEMCLVEAHN